MYCVEPSELELPIYPYDTLLLILYSNVYLTLLPIDVIPSIL